MVSGTLAPLYSFWVKVGLKRGSGSDRGQSCRMGKFPVRPSVHLFPPSRAQEPARQALDPSSQASEAWLAGSEACLAGSWALEGGNGRKDGRTDGWTDVRTDKAS